MDHDKVTLRQLMAIAFVGLLAPIIQFIPKTAVGYGGRASWLAPLAAVIPLGALVWLFCVFLAARREGEGLTHLLIRILGRPLGSVVGMAYAIWFVIYAGLMLRSTGERFLSTIYESGSLHIFLIVTLLLVVIGARGHLKSLARSAEVFVLFLAGLLVFIFLFSIPQVEVENLLPVTYLDASSVGLASLAVVHAVSPFIYLAFLTGGVKKDPKPGRTVSVLVGVLLLVTGLLLVTTIGTFGEALAGRLQNTFFSMIRDISIFNIIERIESEAVAIWVVTDFVFLSMLLMASGEISRVVFRRENRRGFVYLAGAVLLLVAYLSAQNAFALTNILTQIVPAVNLVAAFIGLPMIYLIGKLRKKL